jgi:hypothetical protein
MRFYVYEHWRPDEGVIFYVGKGQKRRAWDTHRGRNRWHKFIFAKLKAIGMKHEVRIVHKGMKEVDALAKERELIAQWRALGADLVNLTDGGEGPSGLVHSEEWKASMAVKMLGRKMSDEARAKLSASMTGNTNGLGKKKPKHAIDAVKAFHTGRKRTPEQCARIAAANQRKFLGRHHTPESIALIRAKQIGIPKPESVKLNMRGKPKSEAHKQKLRAANLGKKHSAEMRKRISENTLAGLERRKSMILETEKLQGNQ